MNRRSSDLVNPWDAHTPKLIRKGPQFHRGSRKVKNREHDGEHAGGDERLEPRKDRSLNAHRQHCAERNLSTTTNKERRGTERYKPPGAQHNRHMLLAHPQSDYRNTWGVTRQLTEGLLQW